MFIAKKKKEEENLEGKRFKLSCLILTHPLTADRCEGKAKAEKVPGVLNTPGDLLLPLGLPDQELFMAVCGLPGQRPSFVFYLIDRFLLLATVSWKMQDSSWRCCIHRICWC